MDSIFKLKNNQCSFKLSFKVRKTKCIDKLIKEQRTFQQTNRFWAHLWRILRYATIEWGQRPVLFIFFRIGPKIMRPENNKIHQDRWLHTEDKVRCLCIRFRQEWRVWRTISKGRCIYTRKLCSMVKILNERGRLLTLTLTRSRFLSRQNLSDPFYDFLDGFSRLRMVAEKIRIWPEPPWNKLSEYVFKNSVQYLTTKRQRKTSEHLIFSDLSLGGHESV